MNTALLRAFWRATPAQPARRAQTQWLQPRATLRLQGLAGARVTVGTGRVWLTETGCDADRFIAAGAPYRIAGAGVVVIECDSAEPALVTIERSPTCGRGPA
jgi:hypothetical protein